MHPELHFQKAGSRSGSIFLKGLNPDSNPIVYAGSGSAFRKSPGFDIIQGTGSGPLLSYKQIKKLSLFFNEN